MNRFSHEPGRDVVCGVQPSLLHNMSVPPRTTIKYRTKPVYLATLVSFRHWLLFRKFADSELPRNKELKKLFRGRSQAGIHGWLEEQGVPLASADQAAAKLGGVLIGKGGPIRYLPSQAEAVTHRWSHLCDDLALTVGLLGRSVGNLFLSSRRPDYTWNALLNLYFIGDDPRIPGKKPPRKVISAELPN